MKTTLLLFTILLLNFKTSAALSPTSVSAPGDLSVTNFLFYYENNMINVAFCEANTLPIKRNCERIEASYRYDDVLKSLNSYVLDKKTFYTRKLSREIQKLKDNHPRIIEKRILINNIEDDLYSIKQDAQLITQKLSSLNMELVPVKQHISDYNVQIGYVSRRLEVNPRNKDLIILKNRLALELNEWIKKRDALGAKRAGLENESISLKVERKKLRKDIKRANNEIGRLYKHVKVSSEETDLLRENIYELGQVRKNIKPFLDLILDNDVAYRLLHLRKEFVDVFRVFEKVYNINY